MGAKFSTVFGWVLFSFSIVIACGVYPLFFIELREPISSGNSGVTGVGLLFFGFLHLSGLALIALGNKLTKKSIGKFAKYGFASFGFQIALVGSLMAIFPDSIEWVWSSETQQALQKINAHEGN